MGRSALFQPEPLSWHPNLHQTTQPESAAILKWHFPLSFIGFTVSITESLALAREPSQSNHFVIDFTYIYLKPCRSSYCLLDPNNPGKEEVKHDEGRSQKNPCWIQYRGAAVSFRDSNIRSSIRLRSRESRCRWHRKEGRSCC